MAPEVVHSIVGRQSTDLGASGSYRTLERARVQLVAPLVDEQPVGQAVAGNVSRELE